MSLDPQRGSVLIIAGEAPGERLRRWVESAGETVVLMEAPHEPVFEYGEETRFDLVVTELDSGNPPARWLLERMIDGEILFGVPQLHLVDDPALHDRVVEGHLDVAAMAIRAPGEVADFQSRVRLAAEIGRLRRELFRSAIHDELSGAHNREYFTMRLDQEVSRACRHGYPLSLVLLELDDFDALADREGVQAAEGPVARMAALLKPRVRREDVFARWDPKTFGVLLSSSAHGGASSFVNRLREAAADETAGASAVHFSAGIASIASGTTRPEDLLRAARGALGRAHESGGDRVFIDPGVLERPRRLVVIADDDVTLSDSAEELFALDGYEVVLVDTPAALFALLGSRRPDLIVLGLELTQGAAHGESLLARIDDLRAENPLPIIALAPSGEGAAPPASTRVRVERFLTKPFSASVLRALARELIGHPPSRRAAPPKPEV